MDDYVQGPWRISLKLPGPVWTALAERARREDRDPGTEAIRILRQRLEADGDLRPAVEADPGR